MARRKAVYQPDVKRQKRKGRYAFFFFFLIFRTISLTHEHTRSRDSRSKRKGGKEREKERNNNVSLLSKIALMCPLFSFFLYVFASWYAICAYDCKVRRKDIFLLYFFMHYIMYAPLARFVT